MGCLILLRVKEKVAQGDPKYHALFQQWDVVTVVPDWWQPGSLDMADGNLLFVECADMEADEAEMRLCGREPGDPKDNPNLRVRALSMKPELMPAEKAAKIDNVAPIEKKKGGGTQDRSWDEIHNEARTKGIFVTMTKSEILAAREAKAPIPNPFKVGDDPFVIEAR